MLHETGAASGIGLATARMLLQLGCTVFATDLNEARLKEVYAGDKNAVVIKMDVSSAEEVKKAAQIVSEHVKVLHGVINSAGVPFAPRYPKTWVQGLIELDVDEFVKPVVDINLFGTMRVNAALFPLLWEAKGAVIFNVGSMGGLIAPHGMGPYAASKFGLMGYNDALRRELAPYRIRVVGLEPGFLRTELAHSIFSPQETYDHSHTRLFAGRGGGEASSPVNTEDLPPPEIVATEIERVLFHDHHLHVPRLRIDTLRNRIFWWIALFIPHHWLDHVMEGGDARRKRVDEEWPHSHTKTSLLSSSNQ